MIRLSCALVLCVVACKGSKEAPSGPRAQAALKADLAGQPMGALYGIAQPVAGEGNSHRLTFSTRPIDCATFAKVLETAGDQDTLWISTHEATQPDGTRIWAYDGASFGLTGTTPANLVAMPAYKVDGKQVSGTLPADAGVEGLRITGSFTVPVCEPWNAPKLPS